MGFRATRFWPGNLFQEETGCGSPARATTINCGRSAITPGYLDFADGSCLITWGRTRVICAATVTEQVPPFRLASGGGWVTGEYAMLPRATHPRGDRESLKGRVGGRTLEIQRLIGRSLRAVVDLAALGPRTVTLDCDVIQADGGTRTASITGAFVALCLALEGLRRRGALTALPLRDQVAAVSVGLVGERLLLDLDYDEDSQARVDANFVGTGNGDLVEVQLTGEGGPFPAAQLNQMLELAQLGIRRLTRHPGRGVGPVAPPTLVMATRNPGKIRELQALLQDSGVTLLSLADFPHLPEIPEEGATFAENAAAKAVAVARLTGHPALADDSGLMVDALKGAPGVFSARYAQDRTTPRPPTDADNWGKLLDELQGVPWGERGARFVCELALARPDGSVSCGPGRVRRGHRV